MKTNIVPLEPVFNLNISDKATKMLAAIDAEKPVPVIDKTNFAEGDDKDSNDLDAKVLVTPPSKDNPFSQGYGRYKGIKQLIDRYAVKIPGKEKEQDEHRKFAEEFIKKVGKIDTPDKKVGKIDKQAAKRRFLEPIHAGLCCETKPIPLGVAPGLGGAISYRTPISKETFEKSFESRSKKDYRKETVHYRGDLPPETVFYDCKIFVSSIEDIRQLAYMHRVHWSCTIYLQEKGKFDVRQIHSKNVRSLSWQEAQRLIAV